MTYLIISIPTTNIAIPIKVSFRSSTFFLPQQQVVYDLVIINIIITYLWKDYVQLFMVRSSIKKVYNEYKCN